MKDYENSDGQGGIQIGLLINISYIQLQQINF